MRKFQALITTQPPMFTKRDEVKWEGKPFNLALPVI